MPRRHGEVLESAIRDAVVELVIEQGAAGVTMEAVAQRAGTSKPVLYRRWPDRAALLRETLVPLAKASVPEADTGSFRGDMLAILHGWAEFFAGPYGAVATAIVGAMPHDPELASAFRDGVIGWRKEAMAAMLDRAIARGEARPDVPYEVARELGQAVLWHRFLVTGDPITAELVEHVVDEILVPYTRVRSGETMRVVETVTVSSGGDGVAAAAQLLHDFNVEYGEPTPPPHELAARLAVLINGDHVTVLLAREPETSAAVGVAVMRVQPSVWTPTQEVYLAELYVVPGQRGLGYGRQLITEVMQGAREQGADYVFVVTSEDDRLAQRLYEAAGFRRTEGEGGPVMVAYEREL